LGTLVGAGLAWTRGRSLKFGIPFVPFMAAGAMLAMCFGPTLMESYHQYTHPEKTDTLRLDIRHHKARRRLGLPPLKPGQ
jgi:hypothetical protein